MAVYTPLTSEEISGFLACYDLGALVAYHGITEGVENSNFLLRTTQGKYILTLFEKRTKAEDLPYFVGLMGHLNVRGIPCPKPITNREGIILQALKGKPALIVSFLDGHPATPPQAYHLQLLGDLCARMHLAAADFPLRRTNALSLEGWARYAEKIGARAEEIEPGLAGLIRRELTSLEAQWPAGLPGGPVHADLFPDNVFFIGKHAGVIDFYFACNDAFAYDLAITVNAWCFDKEHRFLPESAAALLAAYQSIRPLTAEEKAAFPILLRGAALRFLLTRAHDWLFHPEGAQVTPKDPLEYARKLKYIKNSLVNYI